MYNETVQYFRVGQFSKMPKFLHCFRVTNLYSTCEHHRVSVHATCNDLGIYVVFFLWYATVSMDAFTISHLWECYSIEFYQHGIVNY